MSASAVPRPALASAVHRWLFDPAFDDGLHRDVERSVAVLIVASVMAVALEQSAAFYQAHAGLLHAFELITAVLFTVEYALRVLAAPALPEFARSRFPRLRYVFSLYALVDLLAIAPFYLSLFVAVAIARTSMRQVEGLVWLFMPALLLALLLTMFFPDLVLWLPRQSTGR